MIDVKELKRRINIKDALEYYGIRFNKKGFATCPFHREKTASLHTKGDIFYCFGCRIRGDIVDFVQMVYGLSFREALEKINADFSLGLGDGTYRPNYEEKELNALINKVEKELREKEDHIYELYRRELTVLETALKVVSGEAAQMLINRITEIEEDMNDPDGLALLVRYEMEKGEPEEF